jgi:hypothetical protein
MNTNQKAVDATNTLTTFSLLRTLACRAERATRTNQHSVAFAHLDACKALESLISSRVYGEAMAAGKQDGSDAFNPRFYR